MVKKIPFTIFSCALFSIAGCESASSPAMATKDAEGRNVIVDPVSGKVQVIDQAGNAKILNPATDSGGGGGGDHKGH